MWREPEAVPVNCEVRVEALARRVGAIRVGADLPRGIRKEKWSPVYVPRVNSIVGLVAGKESISSMRPYNSMAGHRTKRGVDDIWR